MIGRLRGVLITKHPTGVLVDVAGIGYEAMIPLSTFEHLPAAGAEVELVTHLQVRDDTLALYAFADDGERELFRQLITVSGVGPKLALAVLSGLRIADFKAAVAAGDADRLRAIPGIGKRTAERLVVDLRDRLGVGEEAERQDAAVSALGCAPEVFRDAVSTLVALGYAQAVAEKAIRRAVQSGEASPTLEDLVRQALATVGG